MTKLIILLSTHINDLSPKIIKANLVGSANHLIRRSNFLVNLVMILVYLYLIYYENLGISTLRLNGVQQTINPIDVNNHVSQTKVWIGIVS
jgi:hypothetical protein